MIIHDSWQHMEKITSSLFLIEYVSQAPPPNISTENPTKVTMAYFLSMNTWPVYSYLLLIEYLPQAPIDIPTSFPTKKPTKVRVSFLIPLDNAWKMIDRYYLFVTQMYIKGPTLNPAYAPTKYPSKVKAYCVCQVTRITKMCRLNDNKFTRLESD